MSYCRWSSMDYQCDLYIYESASGWECHVAHRRKDFTGVELPPRVSIDDVDAYMKRYLQVSEILDNLDKWIVFSSPHAGEVYICGSPGEMADMVEMLRKDGFQCPDGVVPTLREEQRWIDKEEQ